ncbi:uncharacterized protein [Hemitrygon akajei]|uniref:uncharacterized protein n=1 Tax=Hemitrygon akajei TaxID=2704970 RepID=UPI003BF9DD1F
MEDSARYMDERCMQRYRPGAAFSTRASSDIGSFLFVSSETQRVPNKMDGGKTNVYVKFAKMRPQPTSNDDPTSTYSELNFPRNVTLIDEDEDPLSASGPGELPITAQTGNMDSERPRRRDISDSSLWLISLLTAALISMGICWRIHVLQISQSQISSEPNYTLLWRQHQDMCLFFTNIREQTCSKDWITYKARCYYVSTFETSFRRAVLQCSKRDSRLLEISSRNEASFVFRSLVHQNVTYWIGKCENGDVAWRLLYNASSGRSDCRDCYSYPGGNPCDSDRRFICEKSAPLFPDIPEKIQDLCLMPLEGS